MNGILTWKNLGLSPVVLKPLTPLIGIVLFIALTLGSAREAAAANCISRGDGNWTVITWTNCTLNPGGDPLPTDTVTIRSGDVVTLDTTTTIAGLTFAAPSVDSALNHSGTNSLTVNGTVTINQGTGNNDEATWNIAAGTGTVSGLITLAGTNTTASRDSDLTISTGTLNANGGITCEGTTPATKDITISSTGSINMKGALNNTGCTFAPGTAGIFNYNDSVAQTVDLTWGAGNYYHLHLNNTSASGVTIPGAITAANVGGNLRVQSGLFTNGGFAITGGAGDTFEVANGARFNLSGTSAMATGFSTFTFGPTSTVNFNGGNQTVDSGLTYGHLILDGGSTKTMAAGTATIAGDFTLGTTTTYNGTTNNPAVNLAGNFTNNGTFNSGTGAFTFNGTAAGQSISGSATSFSNLVIANTNAAGVTPGVALTIGTFTVNASSIFNAGALSHSVTGSFTNNGTFNANSSTFTFNGSAAQSITGATTFFNLTMNNAAGLTINNDVTVGNAVTGGTLTLTSGNITTGTNTLIIGTITSCNVTRTSGHVNGRLRKNFTATQLTCNFEIGDSTNYTPVSVTFGTVTVASSLTASTTNTDHPQIASSNINSAQSVNRYWTLTPGAGITFSTAALTFTYINGSPVDHDNTAVVANYIVQRYDIATLTWNDTTRSGTPTSTQTTITGVSSFGTSGSDFAIGITSTYSREREWSYQREVY